MHTSHFLKNQIQYLKCILTQAALGSEIGNIYKGLLYSAWLSGWWCHCSEHPVWNTKQFG